MRRNMETTLAACDVFRAWHRSNFVLKEPALEQRAEHAMDVRLLVLTLRWLQSSISNPTSSAARSSSARGRDGAAASRACYGKALSRS